MKVNRLSPDIYEIEDFVTIEQTNQVLEYCKSLEESDWWHEEQKDTFFYGKQKVGELPDVFKEINANVQNLFSTVLYVGDVVLQRYLASHTNQRSLGMVDGEPMQIHRDYWLKDLDYYIRYGIVIYYNDDYVGGEIQYPELSISHKPKARSLVLHGGNVLHGPSKVIGDGARYFSTAFVRGSVDSPVLLNQSIFGDVEQHDGSNYP